MAPLTMTWTLTLPPWRHLAADARLATSPLARWRARGDCLPDAMPGRECLIRDIFLFAGTSLPIAALTRELDAGDAAGSLWLRADPAYVRADMVTARLMACGELGLTREECDALVQPLRPLFGDAGFPLEATTTSRWYLRCPPGAQLPTFATPDEALGADLGDHLPSGDVGRRWRSLFTEAQVLLHNHPVNRQRIARGQVPANALWFWGAGLLPEWVKSSVTAVHSDDEVVRALAQRAGVEVRMLADAPAGEGEVFVDLATTRADTITTWIERADAALATKRTATLQLMFESGERWHVTRGQRWRFWRRVRPLSAA